MGCEFEARRMAAHTRTARRLCGQQRAPRCLPTLVRMCSTYLHLDALFGRPIVKLDRDNPRLRRDGRQRGLRRVLLFSVVVDVREQAVRVARILQEGQPRSGQSVQSHVVAPRRGEAWRGVARRGEARRGEARRGEARRGRGEARQQARR